MLNGLFVAFVVSITSLMVVIAGILSTYFAVLGILQAFSHRAAHERGSKPRRDGLILLPSVSTASGD
ncbi:MAG: hypothetical protein JOY93_07380 [Acidobacteriales bacterium]|nr:hypothetical protein [Terriglobales bacterium]